MLVRLHLQRYEKENQTVQTLITVYYGTSAIATQTYSTDGCHGTIGTPNHCMDHSTNFDT